jgi:hypothetical protein
MILFFLFPLAKTIRQESRKERFHKKRKNKTKKQLAG